MSCTYLVFGCVALFVIVISLEEGLKCILSCLSSEIRSFVDLFFDLPKRKCESFPHSIIKLLSFYILELCLFILHCRSIICYIYIACVVFRGLFFGRIQNFNCLKMPGPFPGPNSWLSISHCFVVYHQH